ncbi:MAG: VanZ family protein [Vicinamibacterales bacterium]
MPYAALAWLLLTLFIAYGTVLPWQPQLERGTWQSGPYSVPDVLQNLLLFLPFGTFGVLALRRPRTDALRVSAVTAIACAFSLAIELSQLFSIDRIASAADVLADTAGALAGGLAARRLSALAEFMAGRMRASGVADAPGAPWAALLTLAFAVISWFPFDITLDVSTMAARLRPLHLDPWQWPSSAVLLAQMVGVAMMACLIGASLRRMRRSATFVIAAAFSAALMVVIDLGRLVMGARVAGLAAMAAQVLGGLLGAALGVLAL